MRQMSKWCCLFALVIVPLWSVGCDESSSDGALKLELGNMREQTIKANGTEKYKYTTTTNGVWQIDYDMVSTGDGDNLRLIADESYTCTDPGNTDAKTCVSDDNLDATTTYEFSLKELTGEETTYRVGVQTGP